MLTTKEEIRAVRQLSTSVKDEQINPFIKDAEMSDLRGLLGERLYIDLDTNPTSTGQGDYPALLNGGTYTYGGFTYHNPGVKAVLIDFASARYRFFGNVVDTPFGSVIKQTQDGQNTSTSNNREAYGAIRKVAKDKWCLVKDYLDRMAEATSTKYTYWYGSTAQIDNDQDLTNINKGTLR